MRAAKANAAEGMIGSSQAINLRRCSKINQDIARYYHWFFVIPAKAGI
jgi:hypothetical protein